MNVKTKKAIFFLVILAVALRIGRRIMTDDEKQIDLLARTIYGESRGEGVPGMQAVANVIMNRVNAGSWYGRTVGEVVLKPYAFSCWNKNDPNYSLITTVDENNSGFRLAKSIATDAYNGKLADLTNGATHYHAAGSTPYWADSMIKTVVIGNHVFYKETFYRSRKK